MTMSISVAPVYLVPVSSRHYPMTQERREFGLSNLSFYEQSHVFILVSHGGYGGVYVYRDAACNREIENWHEYPAIADALGWVLDKYVAITNDGDIGVDVVLIG